MIDRRGSPRFDLLVTSLLALTTCRAEAPPAQPTHQILARHLIPEGRGISDLSLGPGGELWAVPERDRQLWQLDSHGAVLNRVPILGVPAGLDTESLALLEDGSFVFGSERQEEGRDHDLLLFGSRTSQGVQIKKQVPLPYAVVGGKGDSNHGIEGLCRAGNKIVAGIERRGQGSRRLAPVAIFDLPSERWVGAELPLTTSRGKLSALFCLGATSGGQLAVLAVERDFGVGRILRAQIPEAGGVGTSEVVAELVPSFSTLPNFEGLVALGDELVLISDNDSGGLVSGPTELVVLGRATTGPSQGAPSTTPTPGPAPEPTP